MSKTKRIHRGWMISAVCLLMLCVTNLVATGMSVNISGIRTDYGLSASSTSFIVTIRSIVSFVAMMFADKYFGRLGLRKGISIAILTGALGFVLLSFGKGNIAVYYAAGALLGITYAYGMMFSVSMLLKRWFNQHRGKALAIASAGTGFTAIILVPLIQSIMLNKGADRAFVFEAVLVAATAAVIFLFVVDDPSSVDMEPVGGKDFVEVKKPGKGEMKKYAPISGRSILLLAICTGMMGAVASPSAAHLTLNFVTNGLPAMKVATAMSVYGVMLIVAKLLLGTIQDRFGSVRTMFIFGSLLILGHTLVGLAGTVTASTSMLFISMIIYGCGVPIESLGYTNWTADLTSAEDYPKVLKKVQMGYQLGGLVFSSVPGVVCDAAGKYGWYYLACDVFLVIIMSVVYATYKKSEIK